MRVHLRHAHVGLYYAGSKHWVSNPNSALDLESIERATEVSRQEAFPQMEIVATFDEPDCELVFPVTVRRVNEE
jgi:hypothetical protein